MSEVNAILNLQYYDCTVGVGGKFQNVWTAYQQGFRKLKLVSNITERTKLTIASTLEINGNGYTITMGTTVWTMSATTYFRDIIFGNASTNATFSISSTAVATDNSIWEGVTVNLTAAGKVFNEIDGGLICKKCIFNLGTAGGLWITAGALMSSCRFEDCYIQSGSTGVNNGIIELRCDMLSSVTDPRAGITFANCTFWKYSGIDTKAFMYFIGYGIQLNNCIVAQTNTDAAYLSPFNSESNTEVTFNGGYIKVQGSTTTLHIAENDTTHFIFNGVYFNISSGFPLQFNDGNASFRQDFNNCTFNAVPGLYRTSVAPTANGYVTFNNCTNVSNRNLNNVIVKSTAAAAAGQLVDYDVAVGYGGNHHYNSQSSDRIRGVWNDAANANVYNGMFERGRVQYARVSGRNAIAIGDFLTGMNYPGVSAIFRKAIEGEKVIALGTSAYSTANETGIIGVEMVDAFTTAPKSICRWTGTSNTTVGGKSAETSLLSGGVGDRDIPPYYARPGLAFRISAMGYYSTLAVTAGTLDIKTKIGSVILSDTLTPTMSDGESFSMWDMESIITVQSLGISSTGVSSLLQSQGVMRRCITTPTTSYIGHQMVGTTNFVCDLSAGGTIDVTATWGTSDASNSITCTNAVIEYLN